MSELDKRLLYSVSNEEIPEIIECFKQGADVNTKDVNGWTPLIMAACRKRPDIAMILLKYHADINATMDTGDTALMLSAYWGYFDMVKFFLKQGADVDVRNNEGKTALELAYVFNYIDVIMLLTNNRKIYDCPEHGENVPIFYLNSLDDEPECYCIHCIGDKLKPL